MIRRFRTILGTSAAVLILAGCGASVPSPSPLPLPVFTISPSTSTSAAKKLVAAPISISVPSIRAKSSLVALDIRNGAIDVPPVSRPQQAGWYVQSPRPGDSGPAIILGHVDGGGHEGVFYRLHSIKVGAEIYVNRADGSTVTFHVTRTAQVKKTAFPASDVYGNTADAEIRLITCGGTFDRSARSYRDSIIVWAKL